MLRSRGNDDLAKQLFSSPTKEGGDLRSQQLRRRAIRREEEGPGLAGVLCFLVVVVVAAVVVPLVMAGEMPSQLGILDLMGGGSLNCTPPHMLNFHGQPILGWVGALPVALLSGLFFGLLTYSCMFYDSNEPGNFPPSPVSPSRGGGPRGPPPLPSALALGYKMVPINAFAFSLIALFLLRLCLNLPLY